MEKELTVAMRQVGKVTTVITMSKAKFEEVCSQLEQAYHDSVQYVDLGLPSGKKWADRNYGSDSIEGAGNYYQYDKAMQLGKNATLPTKEDFQELKDECTWKWVERGNTKGYEVTGKNGNSIFLPAAGYGYGTSLDNAGSRGLYWSSSFSSSAYAYNLLFHSGGINPQNASSGFTVSLCGLFSDLPQTKERVDIRTRRTRSHRAASLVGCRHPLLMIEGKP